MARRRKFRTGPSRPNARPRPSGSQSVLPPTELPADPLAGAEVLSPETETELASLNDIPEGPLVGVVIGAESDREVMQPAMDELTERSISFEVTVASAHRDPDQVRDYARGARTRGIKVIIAGAGLAAALPGSIAAQTDLPVIGVPIRSENAVSGGLDALLSIAQSPDGTPVASVGVNAARNAALLAARILFT